jgi:hypothetical protein
MTPLRTAASWVVALEASGAASANDPACVVAHLRARVKVDVAAP